MLEAHICPSIPFIDDTNAIRAALNASSSLLRRSNGNNKESSDSEQDDDDDDFDQVIVWFPNDRTFLSQPLNITSSYTTLQIDGILQSIIDEMYLELWPQMLPLEIYNTSEDGGHYLQYQSFIYAYNVSNIIIRGHGVIDGNGPWWWDAASNRKDSTIKLQAGRPNVLQFVSCSNIEITQLTIRDSPFWCIHPVLSTNIYIHHMKIRARTYAYNSDGIDPDSSTNVLIEYNDIGCGDDHIAIKAGRCDSQTNGGHYPSCATTTKFQDGTYETNNVTVRYNTFRNGMGITIGSESSGNIHNVNIHNNMIGICLPGGDCGNVDDTCCGWSPALHVKTTLARGGSIQNISFHDNTVYNTSGFIRLSSHYQTNNDDVPIDYPPVLVRNISFVRNRAIASGDNGVATAIGATWDCSQHDPCYDITVIDNYIAVGDHNDDGAGGWSEQSTAEAAAASTVRNPWSCNYIKTFNVSGNYPPGLKKCMEESMNKTKTNDDTGEEKFTIK